MKNIKTIFAILMMTGLLLLGIGNAFAKTDVDETPAANNAEGLDLHAVSEVFKEAENLEDFEKRLNDPQTGINNLDLDENGSVDYLRVEEKVAGSTHLVVLQTQFSEDDVQDVATIALEKEDEETCEMQIQGDPLIYGANYYIVPVYRNIVAWPIVRWIYRPGYRPYRSIFGFRVFPRWWRVRRPVAVGLYRSRTVRFVGRRNFVASKTVRVKTVRKVNYRPRASVKVVKKKKVVVKNGNKKVVKKGVKKTVKTKKGTKTKTKVKVKRRRN